MDDNSGVHVESGYPSTNLLSEFVQNPLNIFILAALIIIIIQAVLLNGGRKTVVEQVGTKLPMLRKDFTIEELKKYDGAQEDGRILIAVSGFVYDVTEAKQFYGRGGPYSAFAGRDASRGLATSSDVSNQEGYDDLCDLTSTELETLRECELQIQQKYEYVGSLLKPGEKPITHS